MSVWYSGFIPKYKSGLRIRHRNSGMAEFQENYGIEEIPNSDIDFALPNTPNKDSVEPANWRVDHFSNIPNLKIFMVRNRENP